MFLEQIKSKMSCNEPGDQHSSPKEHASQQVADDFCFAAFACFNDGSVVIRQCFWIRPVSCCLDFCKGIDDIKLPCCMVT